MIKDSTHSTGTSQPDTFYGIRIPTLPEPAVPIDTHHADDLPVIDGYLLHEIKHAMHHCIANTYPGIAVAVQYPNEAVKKHLLRSGVCIDLAIPAFQLLRQAGADGVQKLAAALVATSEYVKETYVQGPFINIALDAIRCGERIVSQVEQLDNLYGHSNTAKGETVVIDCSSPNIAKYMSVAHLRSTVIGESLYHLLKAVGYTPIRDNHLGDWGTQFGMLGRSVDIWGDEITELRSQKGSEVIKGLFKLYVKIHEEVHKQKNVSNNAESDLEQEGKQWFLRLERGEKKAIALWKWAKEISLIEFKAIYARLGVDFEYLLGESFYVPLESDLVATMTASGLASVDEKGRKVIEFAEDTSLHPLVIQKSDGTGLYSSRDLCTLAIRTHCLGAKKIIYVVGADQEVYLRQLFKAYTMLVGKDAPEMQHVHFGLLSLPDGKMSTRKGNVVFLEDLIDEAVKRAKARVTENLAHNNAKQHIDIDSTAEAIGVGAVIYSDIGDARKRNIIFNWDAALTFEGNSGPYLQYTYARMHSIEKKLKESSIEIIDGHPLVDISEYERQVLMLILEFPETVIHAAEKLEPSVIAKYLYKLASAFSNLYGNVQFINEPDLAIRSSRIRIMRSTRCVLGNGMRLLNMPIVERM